MGRASPRNEKSFRDFRNDLFIAFDVDANAFRRLIYCDIVRFDLYLRYADLKVIDRREKSVGKSFVWIYLMKYFIFKRGDVVKIISEKVNKPLWKNPCLMYTQIFIQG